MTLLKVSIKYYCCYQDSKYFIIIYLLKSNNKKQLALHSVYCLWVILVTTCTLPSNADWLRKICAHFFCLHDLPKLYIQYNNTLNSIFMQVDLHKEAALWEQHSKYNFICTQTRVFRNGINQWDPIWYYKRKQRESYHGKCNK